MKKLLILIIGFMFSSLLSAQVYKNPSIPVKDRVEDLLKRMTLDEKIGQMNQFLGLEYLKTNRANLDKGDAKNKNENVFYPHTPISQIEAWTKQGIIGSYLMVFTAEEANYLQRLAMQSRLGIPLLFGIDAIHGNAMCDNMTTYPSNINAGCSFDPELTYKIARETAEEMVTVGMRWAFNPNVEIARDARWGRVGETFGEDPYLVSVMGEQIVRGLQRNLNQPTDVLACIKHFVAGSQPLNGKNVSPADISERTLREVFFPPFKAGTDAGAATLMVAHNEVNGIPCHTNQWLMQDVLRGEWKWAGFIVSDWMDLEHVWEVHKTASSMKEAFCQAINAGLDMHMQGIHWQDMVKELVLEGRISEERINQSVRRILTTKFQLGLFEHPYTDEKLRGKVCQSQQHMQTALEAARNSIVLLKNEGNLLPLSEQKYKKVLVTGVNANSQNILGDWSNWMGDKTSTVLKGLEEVANHTDFIFVDQGTNPRFMKYENVAKAVNAAKDCDLNLVIAGEYMPRSDWNNRTDGENLDRSDLNLVGLQEELIEKLYATGKPTVVVLINGRPLSTEWISEHIPALIEAFAPGIQGGRAIAEILYGKVNPSAKLAITIPRNVGQTVKVYNEKPSASFHPFTLTDDSPLYPFGYGLSYTKFKYSNMHLSTSETSRTGKIEASIDISNTGSREGTEVVQLYIRDCYSNVSRPVKELKDFRRIFLKPGESQTVSFVIPAEKLAYYNEKMEWTVESGEFEIMIGSSSEDRDLLKKSIIVK
ncbi:glycoside hydrolase family 3 N-terminal domain-containing protein [Prevotella sp. KH2C16]|uniref:glycoside hydrolase family 3 N-terminal domain-containing protein n=1 Tax=Prevotella sp. KH2C16 TaxID=1855325 RepID=UPI000B82F8EA|nr:glycoside hydrolase family 3 N-terminal domain-containing protein [Prevotella sp. KH2C16]